MNEERKIVIEEVEAVETPPRASAKSRSSSDCVVRLMRVEPHAMP